MTAKSKQINILRASLAGIFTGIVLAVVIMNSGLISLNLHSSLAADSSLMSRLTPSSRFQTQGVNSNQVIKQTGDVLYFTTDMSRKYDKARIKIVFQNHSGQDYNLGFQDQSGWHYQTKMIDSPILNQLFWPRIQQDGLVLFQKTPTHNSISDFLAKASGSTIGTYNYSKDNFITHRPLPDYLPSSQSTIIDTPLRGSYSFYAYVHDQPFHLTIRKQDLNWYPGADVMDVTVVKDGNTVFTATADDDGIDTASHTTLKPQQITINNPGPGFPENGVYKITVNTSSDVITSGIETNLHKIVFDNSIYPVSNSTVYSSIVHQTKETVLYTSSPAISLQAFHPAAYQTVQVSGQPHTLSNQILDLDLSPPVPLSAVVLPRSDVVVTIPSGYFSFSPEAFFQPHDPQVYPITSLDTTRSLNYVLASFSPSKQENGWSVAQIDFDLSSAYPINDRLSWILQSSGLSKHSGEIIIKSIDVDLQRQGKIQ